MRWLYRGVTAQMHGRNNGHLIPKTGEAFKYTFKYGESGHIWGSGATRGESTPNAVIRHQLNQAGFPTSGISTTPLLERALLYARGKSGKERGYIYKIDRLLLANHCVIEFIVADYAKHPSIPEDKEIILVSADQGPLPDAIIVEVLGVPALDA